MKLLCLFLSLFAVGACGRADAATTDLPTLTVDFVQSDSARVIAKWARPCDAKGCADAYRVQWTAGALTRLRTIAVVADTYFVARPAVGDSLLVSVVVTSIRRGIVGSTRTSTAVVRNPDAPPPAVDSLRTDTLNYEAALLDSFPVDVIRSTLGQKVPQAPAPLLMSPPSDFHLCYLSRNRYTGEVRILVPSEAPPEADEAIAARCEVARQLFAAERDG
ncbi:hypothetical protein [Gemmatimonas sp.]